MTAHLTLYNADGTVFTERQCISFSLLKERYLPYDTLTAAVLCETVGMPNPVRAVFALDGVTLHDGIVRSCKTEQSKNRRLMQVTSRGFGESLLHNQLVPGLYFHVTLESLMTTYALPHLTYESGLSETNYIYVKESTAMWDAVSAFNYKYNLGYPYVTRCNHLRMTPKTGDTPIVLPQNNVTARSVGGDASAIVSRIDMADIDGTYGQFTMSNPRAAERGIVRVKQIPCDRQFLYNPEDALAYRIAYSNRRLTQKSVSYLGYCGEDLEDAVTLNGFVTGRVSRILLRGNQHGIQTTDTFYFDDFCNT
ncbi:MAG: hypothetical protein MJ062_06910 [Oscillospiraceae bacterium]|nr:hypothetical protein [Oscillospiraceae bacterium]